MSLFVGNGGVLQSYLLCQGYLQFPDISSIEWWEFPMLVIILAEKIVLKVLGRLGLAPRHFGFALSQEVVYAPCCRHPGPWPKVLSEPAFESFHRLRASYVEYI